MIGFFDSGVGGLSVVRELRRIDQASDIVYVADQSHAPYGEQELESVRDRAIEVAAYLIDRGADPVVVACNSASAAALTTLRAEFSTTRFVGMEPAVKPAALASTSGLIAILATEATFQGELFASLVDRHARDIAVIARACPGLAAAIEDDVDGPEVQRLLTSFVGPLVDNEVDAVVLGCTHYSLVGERIGAIVGPGIAVIDPTPAVARRTMEVAGFHDGLGASAFVTTADPVRFTAQIGRLLGIAPDVRGVDL